MNLEKKQKMSVLNSNLNPNPNFNEIKILQEKVNKLNPTENLSEIFSDHKHGFYFFRKNKTIGFISHNESPIPSNTKIFDCKKAFDISQCEIPLVNKQEQLNKLFDNFFK